jgi:DNA helicase-2/ATP-dependent DNA helicase PcrA
LAAVHAKLRHLIVDEYQDINPAQEALIRLLSKSPVQLCVVGDDDQSIYQWRGSDVTNILTFGSRYKKVSPFRLLKNRRSRPAIIDLANGFATTIQGRLAKVMERHRPASETGLAIWRAPTEIEEANVIAETIVALKKRGYRYRDMAILVRSSTAYPRLLQALAGVNVPVQPGGRTGLFKEPDAQLFGRTFAYLVDSEWRPEAFGPSSPVDIESLVASYATSFALSAPRRKAIRKRLEEWKKEVAEPQGPSDLIKSYYEMLAELDVGGWDFGDPVAIARLGNLARCSALLADYESVRRRSRPDEKVPGEVVGGQDRGVWYYRWLAIHIQNWALGAFEGFEGEESFTIDAVDLTTVHKSKGLEWPIVFVPSVTAKRFPSSNTGKSQNWHLPPNLFDKRRYEGTVNDERRLFYVAMTRAREWLSLSAHDTPNKQKVAPSPFLLNVHEGPPPHLASLPLPSAAEARDEKEDLVAITFSELMSYKSCGLAYRLRNLIGFQPSLAPELGFGKAVHHLMRNVAEHTRRHKTPPSPNQLEMIFDQTFYLPAANKVGHRQMKDAARKLVNRYITQYGDDLKRVWAIERPFELHLENAIITGRADVILDEEDGVASSLAIVDYKTATDEDREYDLQLQIYADAGKREGLDVKAAYVHDLKAGDRIIVDVSALTLKRGEAEVVSLVDRLRSRKFDPNPGKACRGCDVKSICRHRA